MTLEQKSNQIITAIISGQITEGEGAVQLMAIGMSETRARDTAYLAITGTDLIEESDPSDL